MSAGIGNAPGKARGHLGTLSPKQPHIDSVLAGIEKLDAQDIMATRAWGNALLRDLDLWCHERGRRNPLREPAREPIRQPYQGGSHYGS